MRRLLLAVPVLLALAGAALAQGVLTPPGSAFGLVPPAGFGLAQGFAGYADAGRTASIVVNELPAAAYDEVADGLDRSRLAGSGITMDKREAFATAAGPGVLVTGRQSAGGLSFAKWLLLVKAEGATGMVVATVPSEAAGRLEAPMRAALATIRYAPVSLADKVAALPFRVTEGPTLRAAATLGGSTLVLAPEGKPGVPGAPLLVVGLATGQVVLEQFRHSVATSMARQIGGMANIVLEEPVTIGGMVEVHGTGTDTQTGNAVRFIQWLAFNPTGYLRIVAGAPQVDFSGLLPEFRAIVASVALR